MRNVDLVVRFAMTGLMGIITAGRSIPSTPAVLLKSSGTGSSSTRGLLEMMRPVPA